MTKILIIEDEEFVRENLLDLLEAEDFETLAAPNGKIGLKLAIAELPDLILCDMMMPELDGYGVLEALRENSLTATIPFIFLTAKSAKADIRKGMDLGADDYLTKPFIRIDLLNAIINKLKKYANFKKHFSHQNNHQKLTPRMQLIDKKLHQVILHDNFQGFYLHYQPIVDLNFAKISGAETLLRWYDDELGLISPGEFIPLAESNGLILNIDNWVLENVCQQIKKWQDIGINGITISVNFSAAEFNCDGLIYKVMNLIEINNLEPSCLEIEVTESMIIKDMESAIAVMNQLRSLGFKIAIDDFGTGQSSLSYLQKFPVNTIKIDRSLVQDIDKVDNKKLVIAKSVIEMAQNLNLKIIAEGVETEAELSFLRAQKCDAIQGYIFSMGLSNVEFPDFFFSHQTIQQFPIS